ncbi:MAG: acyl-CoA dehydrogenase family protein [Sinimarinibacterium sp.]|jgi:acyl-CoA dehydrogenase
MDFNDTPAEAAFRAEVRRWLAANAPPADALGYDAAALPAARAWQARKAAAGYAAITWPVALGGRGGRTIEEVIYRQEESRYGFPGSHFAIGLGICLPTLMSYATPEQVARHVRPALYGEEIWCQLFSEPAAGSDVAGIRTRAQRDGEDWVVNGQKCWTSGAEYADFGLLLARTDAGVPKHRGLTVFFVDMKSPGIRVRPIRQSDGGSEFSEVFFTDLHIPDCQRLGGVGEGWKVVLTTLMHERNLVGGNKMWPTPAEVLDMTSRLTLDRAPASRDLRVRARIADWEVDHRGLVYLYYRALTSLGRGQAPGPEQALHKLVSCSQGQEIACFLMDLMGPAGAMAPAALGSAWASVEKTWWWSSAQRIAGGTDEILKNIIAERVLGLPADVRVDKDVPFSELAEIQRRTA